MRTADGLYDKACGAFSLSAHFHKNVTNFSPESVAKKMRVWYNTHIYLHFKERERV